MTFEDAMMMIAFKEPEIHKAISKQVELLNTHLKHRDSEVKHIRKVNEVIWERLSKLELRSGSTKSLHNPILDEIPEAYVREE